MHRSLVRLIYPDVHKQTRMPPYERFQAIGQSSTGKHEGQSTIIIRVID